MLKIMLVHDALPEHVGMRRALIEAGHIVVAEVDDLVTLPQAVDKHQPDVIMIATGSPGRDTLEHLCLATRDTPRAIVMFSDDKHQDRIREAIQAGVTAYVYDGIQPHRIVPILDVAMARFEAEQHVRRELANTRNKLEERKLVERAKGLLMSKEGMTEEDAYHAMRKMAMDKNVKMVDVAKQVIDIAKLLGHAA